MRCTNSRFASALATRISEPPSPGATFTLLPGRGGALNLVAPTRQGSPMAESVLILIPARMASTRLPGKPLADIGGRPMIAHVLDRAVESGLGPVVVATDSEQIATAVEKAGGRAVMTRADHLSG